MMENTRSSLEEYTLEYKFGKHKKKPDYDQIVESLKKKTRDIQSKKTSIAVLALSE